MPLALCIVLKDASCYLYLSLEFLNPIKKSLNECTLHLKNIAIKSSKKSEIIQIVNDLEKIREPIKKDVFSSFRKTLLITRGEKSNEKLASFFRSY